MSQKISAIGAVNCGLTSFELIWGCDMKQTIEVSLTQEDIDAAIVNYVAQKYGTVQHARLMYTIGRGEGEAGYNIRALVRGEVDNEQKPG